jgi:protein TonB
MAYTDPKPMAPSRVWAIIIVVAIHVLGLWAMFNGGYAYTKKVLTDLEVIEVKEPPPPPEKLPPPPPPDTKLPPPPVVPPPIVQTNTPPPPQVIQSVPTPPPFNPPPAPPAPPPPPAPPAVAVQLSPRGSPQSWVTNDDYPPSAQRDGVEGSTGVRVQVGPDGRVTACAVTSSSGSTILDDTACRLVTRRARFNPAKEAGGSAIASSWAGRFRWQIQK